MTPRDIAALVNAVAVPLEVIAILAALALTGKTLNEQGADAIIAILGGQVAATVGYIAQKAQER